LNDDTTRNVVDLEDETLLREYVGGGADYYLSRWKQLAKNGGMSVGFNVAAFLLSGPWLFYRKLYRPTIVLCGVTLLGSVVKDLAAIEVLSTPELRVLLSPLLALAVAFVVGKYGTYWYYRQALRAVARAKSKSSDEVAQIQCVRKRGGTSIVAVILGLTVLPLCLVLLSSMIGRMFGLGAP